MQTAIEERRSSELGSSCCSQTHLNFLIKEFSHFAAKTTAGIRDSTLRHLTVTGPSQVLTGPVLSVLSVILLVWSTLTLPAPLSSE